MVTLKNLNKAVDVDVDVNMMLKETLLKLLRDNPKLSQKSVAKELSVSYRKVQNIMSLLHKKGVISRIGNARNGYWIFGRNFDVDVDVDVNIKNAVVNLILENPKVSQKSISKEIGVSYRKTQEIMRALQEKGTISRIGKARSGYWRVN